MAMTPEAAPSADPFEQVLTPKEQEASVTRGVDQIPQPAPQPVAVPQKPVAANDDDDDEEEAAPSTPAAPVAEGEDPFASFPEVKARDVSKTGAFLRGAGREALPAIGSVPAMAAGAEVGAVVGSVGGPVGSLVGGLVGGIAGGMLGSTAISSAQEWALKKLPDGWTESIGMDDRQKRLDEEQAPTSSFLGALVPFVVVMRPGAIPKGVLPENATATQRVLANPVTARVFGGGIMGGMELASELGGEDDVEWTHVAIATGFGVVFNKPTKLGQRIMDVGGKPARRALGREEPAEATVPAKAPDETAPVTSAPETPLSPDNVQVATERVPVETPATERPAPTVAEVGDLKVVGPGITEEVYMGSHEQSPIAAQTAQEARRAERSFMEPPVTEDVNATAQQMHPELFEHYEQLQRRRDEFRKALVDEAESGVSPATSKHLADTEAELRELAPQMAAAYRRAAEATGATTVEAPLPDPQIVSARPIAEQRAFISNDVSQKLIQAGRPKEEADAAAQMIAARYEARAARMQGALGDAQDIYMAEGADIRGGKSPPEASRTAAKEFSQSASESGSFQTHMNRAGFGPEQLANFSKRVAESSESGGVLGGESDVAVMNEVRGAVLKQGKILDSIVRSVPVDMVNNLFGSESAAKVALHNEAVLKNASAFDTQLPIASLSDRGRAVRLFMGEVARGIAERPANSPMPIAGALEGAPTVSANEIRNFNQGGNTKNASITLRNNGKPLIKLFKTADESSFLHETGHQWLEELMRDGNHPKAPGAVRDDAQTVRDWLGVKGDDEIKTRHHEKFARGFEQYFREGVAPSPGLAGVFAKFKNWLMAIYETAKRLGAPINEDIRGVFDRMISANVQRTVIADEAPSRQTIHDHHVDEAKYLAPHEADAAADRIAAESGRVVEELPPEIRNEIQAKVEQIEAAETARTDAAGETGGSGAERKPVGAGGPERGPEPASSGGGERALPVSERGTQSEAQGAGAFSATERASRRQDAGDGLSPQPAEYLGPAESGLVDKAGNIRLDNINTDESIKQVLREVAAQNDDFIGDRRGVVTDGQVLHFAYKLLGSDPDFLLQKKIGDAFNAEEIKAAEILVSQSAKAVAAAMRTAATGSDADVMAYAQARTRHQFLQAKFSQATAESGRAQRALRRTQELWSGESQIADAVLAKETTGKTLFQLRQEAQLGMTLETPEQVSKFMHDASRHSFGRMILETWINAILSGPATHSTNIIGNTILSLQHFGPETAIAAAVGRVRKAMGREGQTVRLGEIAAALQGAKRSAAGALEATGQSARLGTSALLPGETVRSLDVTPHNELAPRWEYDEATTFHQVMENAFGAVQGFKDAIVSSAKLLASGGVEGAPLIGPQYSHTGAIPDIAIKGVNVLPIGTIIRGPGRALAAADTFFRAANYSAAKNALAYRMASEEGLTGVTFDKRVAELRDNPTPEMMEESRSVATEQTLQSKGGKFVQAMNSLANATVNLPIIGEIPPLKFINPFVNIASQIIKQTLVKRTPLGILSPELRADLMGQNGNVAQDMAQARMLMGTGVAVTMGMLAANGYATGSGPKKPDENAMWRLAGNQAHSIRIGDFWYDTSKLGPLGMLMGIAADMYEVATKAKDKEYTEAAAKFHHAITQNILDQSFMKGPADLIQAVEDPERYGGRYIRNFLSSFVPYSNALAQATRRTDPYTRETRTLLDAIKAKIPWESQSLMPRRDIWGEPMAQRDAVGGAGVTAIYAKQMSADPVNLALLNLGMGIAPVPKKIRGVELTPEQYDNFSRIAGRMTKMRLDVLVKSPDFQMWAPESKRHAIVAMVQACREGARGVLFGMSPQIAVDAYDLKRKKFKRKEDK